MKMNFPRAYCLNQPNLYTYYVRDAQGNVLATYRLGTSVHNRSVFFEHALDNIGVAMGVGTQPSDIWDEIGLPFIMAEGRLRDEVMRLSGRKPVEALVGLTHDEVFDADPALLPLVVGNMPTVHPIGFWAFDPTAAATAYRQGEGFDAYALAEARRLADSAYAAEFALFHLHEQTLEQDIADAFLLAEQCINTACPAEAPCLSCENLRTDTAAYRQCLLQQACTPPYCQPACPEWLWYDTLAMLRTLNYRYDTATAGYEQRLLNGTLGLQRRHYFTGTPATTPRPHTLSAAASEAVTGLDDFRSYADSYYGHTDWKPEVAAIATADRLVRTHLPRVARLWLNEAGETLIADSTTLLDTLAAVMADSSSPQPYAAEAFLTDIDQAFGAGTWPVIMMDTTDTGALGGHLRAYVDRYPATNVPPSVDAATDFFGGTSPATELRYTLYPEEYYVYGSQRLGSIRHYTAQSEALSTNRAGRRRYEVSDHLGNVRAVMSDRLAVSDAAHRADQWATYDYYPFGMPVAHRTVDMAEFKASTFTNIDSVEVVTYDDPEVLVQPTSSFAMAQPLSATGTWFARAWNSASASGDPDYEDSTYVQNTPYTFQNGNGNVELMLTGPGHGKRQIVYRFKMSDYPAVQLGDRLTFKFNATCNHSFANPIIRVVERHSGIQVLSVPFSVSTPNLYVENIITFTITDPHMEVIVESQNPNVSLSNHLLVRDWRVYWKEKHVDVVQNPTDTAYWTKDSYRYGFQGQEADNEINGLGNTWNYTFRMHNAKYGRFMSLDPLAPDYPHNSPYAFSENRVVDGIELEGLERAPLLYQTDTWYGKALFETYNAMENSAKTIGSVPQKLESAQLRSMGTSHGELEGEKGFKTYTAIVDNTGKAIQLGAPLAGPAAPLVALFGKGLSLSTEGMNTLADFEQKPIETAKDNLKIRIAANATALAIDEIIPTNSTEQPILEHVTKSVTGGVIDAMKDKKIEDIEKTQK